MRPRGRHPQGRGPRTPPSSHPPGPICRGCGGCHMLPDPGGPPRDRREICEIREICAMHPRLARDAPRRAGGPPAGSAEGSRHFDISAFLPHDRHSIYTTGGWAASWLGGRQQAFCFLLTNTLVHTCPCDSGSTTPHSIQAMDVPMAPSISLRSPRPIVHVTSLWVLAYMWQLW